MLKKKHRTILVAPLDWGLGHTTRCIPLIFWLQRHQHRVIFAGNASQRSFIENTFPSIEIIHLDGYDVSYGTSANLTRAAILKQVPGIRAAIRRENHWLSGICKAVHLDGIISDNRYGLYNKDVRSVILTHQLHVLSGAGLLADNVLQRLHYRFLERFSAVWVPDQRHGLNLGGILSHPASLPHHTEFVGWLTQFQQMQVARADNGYLLILLSGPEPQRSILSSIIWQQLPLHKGKVVFVAGSEAAMPPTAIPPNVSFYPRLTGMALASIVAGASMIICRSGYSSIMDLVYLHKKAILIPTPGQTEQHYLAHSLREKGLFQYVKQDHFSLLAALADAESLPDRTDVDRLFDQYGPILRGWVEGL